MSQKIGHAGISLSICVVFSFLSTQRRECLSDRPASPCFSSSAFWTPNRFSSLGTFRVRREFESTKREFPLADCSITDDGILLYHGKHSFTRFHHECVPWHELQTVYSELITEPNFFTDASIAAAQNFCRNPNLSRRGPWCFVEDGDEIRMEECGVCQSLRKRDATLVLRRPSIRSRPSNDAVDQRRRRAGNDRSAAQPKSLRANPRRTPPLRSLRSREISRNRPTNSRARTTLHVATERTFQLEITEQSPLLFFFIYSAEKRFL